MLILDEKDKGMEKIKTSFITKEKFPLVIEPTERNIKISGLEDLLIQQNSFFKENLLHHGALLLRNFPVHNEDDFSKVLQALGAGKTMEYIGGDSPRNKIKDGIYTSTEAPPSIKIPLHNELSFVKYYPKHIYFYCHVAPEQRGETIIADARKVYQGIDSKVRNRFIEKGLRYVSCYYDKSQIMDLLNQFQRSHKPWKDVFETEDKLAVEKMCLENEFSFQWNKDNWLQISQVRPATLKHPITQEDVWFNQAHLYDFNPKLLGWWRYLASKLFYFRKHTRLHEVSFADKTKIPRADLYHIMDVLDANTVYFPWQKGDVLILDNVLAMHGRATFSGKRRILAAMTS